ncbi:MAG TPA: winged helix-turn-helix domain-containing protein [Trebonia sp.]|nr:winged helix-turn-helix domain-containing protein [Trebonia sp.]
MRIGTRLLPRPEAAALGTAGPAPLAEPGGDGMLLAIVPIPGTGTSLAIVGYPVSDEILPGQDHAVGDEPRSQATGLLLDHEQRQVWADGKEVSLTYQEFELLAFLAAHPATVFSRSELVARVWQRDFTADSRTVDVHVSRLRQKLGERYGRCLVTEYRVGYQFRSTPPRP